MNTKRAEQFTTEEVLVLIMSGVLETVIVHGKLETDIQYRLNETFYNSIALGDTVGITDLVEIIKNDMNETLGEILK